MTVIGHTLVWHSQTPAWVWAGPDGGLADRATMLERMRTHITTVVGRYKGQIRGWDVVNEALNDDGTLRDSPWRRGIGDDYIARRSSSHKQADPDAELYYNDYNLATRPAKRAGAIRIIKDLQQRGLRIDAVGEQGHWRLESPTPAEIDQTITELRATGLKVMITELDVNLLPPAGRRRRSAAAARSQSLRERIAGGRAAGARALLRRRLPRLSEASRRHHARDVLGRERRRLVAQPRAREPSAAVGSPAAAQTGVRREWRRC